MNGILKMILSIDQAKAALKLCKKKKLMIVDKKHGIALDDEIIDAGGLSVNLGGYGTSFSVNIGENFGNSWGLTGYVKRKPTIYSDTGSVTQWESFSVDYFEERGKTLTDLSIFFSDKKSSANYDKGMKWEKSKEEFIQQIEKLGGKVVDQIEFADVVVALRGTIYNAVDMIKSNNDVIVIDQNNFLKLLPKPLTDRAEPVKKFTGDAGSLWKLLSAREFSSIRQGLQLATSLPDQIDALLDGCALDKSGELSRSKRFTGTGPALAYLDVALYGLLSIAPDGSKAGKLRLSIRKMNISVGEVPKLIGFDSLNSLSIEFPENNAELQKDLSNFGLMPNLKTLKFSSKGYQKDALQSLKGLNAPKLVSIEASYIGLQDISSLAELKNLVTLDFQGNEKLKSIDGLSGSVKSITSLILYGCKKIQTIDALQGAVNLRKLEMRNCDSIKSLKPLSECTQFESLDIESNQLQSLEGLENIVVKNIGVTYEFNSKDSMRLTDLLSLKIPGADSKFSVTRFSIGR